MVSFHTLFPSPQQKLVGDSAAGMASSSLSSFHLSLTKRIGGRNSEYSYSSPPSEQVRTAKVLPQSSCSFSVRNTGGIGVGSSDGVIIVDHGSRRRESNAMLDEFVTMFKIKTGYPIVQAAHMELATPTIKDAFTSCVQQGAKRIIVSPFFLSPGRHWQQDIPSLAAEAAQGHSGISYLMTAPLGLHELMVEVMNDRIVHCLKHIEGEAEECQICAGTGKCKLRG